MQFRTYSNYWLLSLYLLSLSESRFTHASSVSSFSSILAVTFLYRLRPVKPTTLIHRA